MSPAIVDTDGIQDSVPAAAIVRFAVPVARLLADDTRRIVVIGASGWIGRNLTEMLYAELGPEGFASRVVCFGSTARTLMLADGTVFMQGALSNLATLPEQPSIVCHLAFLTKDKVASMTEADYVAGNRRIFETVAASLHKIGADRLFVASSGAAEFADDPAAAADLRLYGGLKRDEEDRFVAWAEALAGRRIAIGRLYAMSGPFINKPETYALADFILAALAGRHVNVRAPFPVYRSYVAVRELLSLVFATLLAPEGPAVLRFDSGGEPLELGALADKVGHLFSVAVERAPFGDAPENRYIGDHGRWLALLAHHQLEHISIDNQIAETTAWLRHATLQT